MPPPELANSCAMVFNCVSMRSPCPRCQTGASTFASSPRPLTVAAHHNTIDDLKAILRLEPGNQTSAGREISYPARRRPSLDVYPVIEDLSADDTAA
ncbi:hypothetical protein MFIFM68171_02531 [Madurella fahalii]|uniref:Uncharacterized protein n=1 Tax=Madurella fahalii TaxID=1157608 RepID=A0ABQ0G3H4_9PEZI